MKTQWQNIIYYRIGEREGPSWWSSSPEVGK